MGERTSYTPGTFSWADLSTPDQDAAKSFYSGLFDWDSEDSPIGDGVVYRMALLGGRYVAALSPQPEQQRKAGAPPVWNSYVTVESADRALEQAAQLGGEVHAGPFDVFTSGRMGVVQDPQGAFFCVWEPREHPGAGLVNARGALSWNELATPDVEASAAFYGELFGWSTQAMEGSPFPYLVIMSRDGRGNGGIREMMPGEPMPYWLVYFGSEDVAADVARIGELGGTTLSGPTDIGVGHTAVAADPLGAVFALYGGRFEE